MTIWTWSRATSIGCRPSTLTRTPTGAVTANHHDFITGTSPDEVVEDEQLPWLERAQRAADDAVERHAANLPCKAREQPVRAAQPAPAFERDRDHLVIRTPHYVLELDQAAGGTIARAWHPENGRPLLARGSADLVSYVESGGTYRMGHEYLGGSFREVSRASTQPVDVQVRECEDGLLLTSTVELNGESYRRALWASCSSPALNLMVEGCAPARHTVAVRIAPGTETTELTMDAPGGTVVRPLRRVYAPTFWPMHRWLHLVDDTTGHGLAMWQALPGAISYDVSGELCAVAVRNATRERVFGLLPIPGNPVTAHEREAYRFDCAFIFTMLAAKPVSRGEGTVIRLYAPTPPLGVLTVRCPGRPIRQAYRCDARERDLEPLPVTAGAVHLTMAGTVATLRILT